MIGWKRQVRLREWNEGGERRWLLERRPRQKQSGDKPVGDYFKPRANREFDARICRRMNIEMDLRRMF